MSKESTKIYIKYCDDVYCINGGYVEEEKLPNGSARPPYLVINAKRSAQIIRQYIKNKYPNIKSTVKSERFSGGSSVYVTIFNPLNGSSVDDAIFEDVNTFCKKLRSGKFDGMTDSFKYTGDTITDNGMRMALYTKFISVDNGADWDTKKKNNWL